MKEKNHYEDIILLPHYQSKTRPHMSNRERAAQFSPFAALKGYNEAIEDAAKYLEEPGDLDNIEEI